MKGLKQYSSERRVKQSVTHTLKSEITDRELQWRKWVNLIGRFHMFTGGQLSMITFLITRIPHYSNLTRPAHVYDRHISTIHYPERIHSWKSPLTLHCLDITPPTNVGQ